MLDFKAEYIAAGGNRHPSAADWDSESDLLAFGANRNVALWKPLSAGHHGLNCLLSGHIDTVNAVKFFKTPGGSPSLIVSGSVDKTIRIWNLRTGTQSVAVLEGHLSSINCLAVCPDLGILVSGSADSTVKIWRLRLNHEKVEHDLLQTIQATPRFFPLALALHVLDSSGGAILATAGTKSTVQVYVSSKHAPFEHQATLAGHEGWIRSLSICRESGRSETDLFLASASQDKYIRLWRIASIKSSISSDPNDSIAAFEDSLSNKRHKLLSSQRQFLLTFEALLLGHEDWIYAVSWHLTGGKLRLLSASADNSLAVWQQDQTSGIWVPVTRLGEISLQKGSTTASGSTGGFWIGLWSSDGTSVVSLGRTGSWRIWTYDKFQERWLQGIGVSGHTKSVADVAWSHDGNYVLSTGLDQTTRLHAKWIERKLASWHELARPQIHGYDLNCIDSISNTRFISGADEKLLRVFDEPRATAESLRDLCGVPIADEQRLTESASIPMLGLSNKSGDLAEKDGTHDNGEAHGDSVPCGNHTSEELSSTQGPATEDRLARHTLWPEREKLYGHGYEIAAVAASHDSTLVATSCKASSLEHAIIRLYTTTDWREVKPALKAHSLTVTALAFAEDDNYLLSVGRDRQWAVFERDIDRAANLYLLKHSNSQGHSRMILDCCWAPSPKSIFMTAGRDKMVKVWNMVESQVDCVSSISFFSPVTALHVAPHLSAENLHVAVGTESGEVSVHVLNFNTWKVAIARNLSPFLCPSKAISRLKWRPMSQASGNGQLQLAVASDDSSLMIVSCTIRD